LRVVAALRDVRFRVAAAFFPAATRVGDFRDDVFRAEVFFRLGDVRDDVFRAVVFFLLEDVRDDDFRAGVFLLGDLRADVFFRVVFGARRPPALAAFFLTSSPTSSALFFTTLPRLSTTVPTMFCAASVERTFLPASAPVSITFFTIGISIALLPRLSSFDTNYPRGDMGQTWPRPGLSQVGRTMAV
jgi:hypothetical protein